MSLKINVTDIHILHSAAQLIASHCQKNDIICFYGDLGAGKTTFIQFFIRSFYEKFNLSCPVVTSPTFSIIHDYETDFFHITHFDLYRIESESELENTGIDDYLEDNICLIEWPQIAQSLLPAKQLHIIIEHTQHGRILRLKEMGGYMVNKSVQEQLILL